MESSYWVGRWENGQIGFHEGSPNAWLEEHVALLGPGDGRRVLVPLCGKTIDLAFLAAHGFEVVGVELAMKAAEAFFEEAGLAPTRARVGEHTTLSAGRITIVVGDFFATTEASFGRFDAVYDRAAVVALPPDMRTRYAATVRALSRDDVVGLVVTFEHDAPATTPPFSVTADELERLFPELERTPLGSTEIDRDRTRFEERGATFAREHAYAVRRR